MVEGALGGVQGLRYPMQQAYSVASLHLSAEIPTFGHVYLSSDRHTLNEVAPGIEFENSKPFWT